MMLDAGIRRARGCGRLGTLAVVLVAGLVVVPAGQAAELLPIISVSPTDGASIAPSLTTPLEIDTSAFSGTCTTTLLSVEVATQNIPGQDGSLANDYVIATTALIQSDATPTAFKGSVFASLYTPGTYYWQASAQCFDTSGFGFLRMFLSPVFTVIVAAPPPPAPVVTPVVTLIPVPVVVPAGPDPSPVAEKPYRMTLVDASYDVPLVISKHDASAGKFKQSCKRLSRSSFKCAASWSDRRYLYAGTLRITDKGDYRPSSTFVGGRAKLSCVRAKEAAAKKHAGAGQVNLQACVKPWRW